MRTCLAPIGLLLLLGGCQSTALAPLTSASAPVVVDGDAGEWAGGLRPVPGEPGLSLGVRNTSDALSLVLVAGSEWQARRLATSGLTLWLDPSGGSARRVGLRFPLGVGGPPVFRDSEAPGPPPDDGPLRQAFAEAPARLATVRGRDARPAALGGVDGVETATVWSANALVVEVRLPLRGPAAAAFAGEATGAAVGLGIEIADTARLTGAGSPPLTDRTSDRRSANGGYSADQDASDAAPQTVVPAEAPRTSTRWFGVALAR